MAKNNLIKEKKEEALNTKIKDLEKELKFLKENAVTIDQIAPLLLELFNKTGKNIADIDPKRLDKNLKWLKEQKTRLKTKG